MVFLRLINPKINVSVKKILASYTFLKIRRWAQELNQIYQRKISKTQKLVYRTSLCFRIVVVVCYTFKMLELVFL